MEDKQLDFNRPLLSVRRHSAQPPPPPPPRRQQQQAAARPPLPFYKSDLKSGPIRNPGIVPFVWEHTPGLPKDYRSPPPAAPNLPPSWIKESNPPMVSDDDDDEAAAFTDAVDTLSRTESFYMNCSVSGVSGFTEQPRPFAADPQVRDFMMGRFLPAAQAAVTSPQRKGRKPAKAVEVEEAEGVSYRQHVPSPYRYGPNFVPPAEIIDEDDDYDDAEYIASRGCGLLPRFCLKSSFCLLNPVPGMKVRSSLRGRTTSPQTRSSLGAVGGVEEESMWEEVYKHKLGNGVQQQGEEGSRVTSESNRLTCWSDSLTADGSSHHQSAGGVSPYRNEVGRNEGKCFLGVPVRENKVSGNSGSDACEKDSEKSSEVHSDGSRQGSGAIDRTLYVDCVQPLEVHSKTSSIASNTEIKGMVKPTKDDSELRIVSKTVKAGLDLESFGKDALQPKLSKLAGCVDGDGDGDNGFKHSDNHNGPQTLEVGYQVKTDLVPLPPLLPPPLPQSPNDLVLLPSLLPLALPQSPSESWLFRTLPSVSSKNAAQQSFLGIQFHRKQALQAGSTNQKKEIIEKPVKVQRQRRFADMLKSDI